MKTQPPAIPEALNRHLAASSGDDNSNLALYVERGGSLVTAQAMAAMRDMLGALREKTRSIQDSERLRSRLEAFTVYFEETLGDAQSPAETRREVAFALFYVLKGYDRIPDSIPEIGLLDDALVVDSVLHRHVTALKAHWQRRKRVWPEGL